MMYLNHDFYKNMVAGAKSGDVVFVTSLFVNELSDLVVFDKQKLVGILNKTNVKAKPTATAETIVDKTLVALPKNVQLQKGLAFLFAEINGLINNNKGNKQTWKQTIDDIANGVKMIANKLAEPGSYAASVKADIMQHVTNKAQTTSGADGEVVEQKGWSKGKKAIVFLGISTVIFFVVRYISKNCVSDAVIPAQAIIPQIGAPVMPPPIQQPTVMPQPTPIVQQQPVQPIAQQQVQPIIQPTPQPIV